MGISTQDISQPRPSSLIPKEQRLISTITDFPSTPSHGTRPPLLLYLKVHGDGGSSPFLLIIGGQKLNLRADL